MLRVTELILIEQRRTQQELRTTLSNALSLQELLLGYVLSRDVKNPIFNPLLFV